MTEENTDQIIVGTIAGAFGVRGEVRLKSYCAIPHAIAEYAPLTTQDGQVFAQIVVEGHTKNGLIARVDGITTKEQADALKGTDLFTQRARLPSLPDDEFYHSDLIGLEVVDTGGQHLGKVKTVQNNGADDLLEIHGPGLKSTVLLPFTKAAIPTVDLAAGRLVADPPEGIF
ncbi:ribosome maturation factor RimM [Aestuariibius sp. HNIBRBA575]|uniref:ribosome maturation factor RimM n=1 Tax=Aestuariibius sp. HNIBRBA575 TaxID=3233343 RepID=UPI0034A26BB3